MNRREDGYTLLEMLVALVVFGLVMAGLAQGFRFGLAAWPVGERNAAPAEDLGATDMALRNMIAQAVPGSMIGRPGGFSFTTRLPEGAGGNGGLADVALQRAPGAGLEFSYAPHPAGIPLTPPPPPGTEPLTGAVTGLSVTYFAPQESGPPVWVDHWRGDGLPLLVRLHFSSRDGRDWPDLVAAPAGAAAADTGATDAGNGL
jgi:general secretion pathway protein J